MSQLIWKSGPLTGRRIRATTHEYFIARRWEIEDGEKTVVELWVHRFHTGTIGPLATLTQTNRALYGPEDLHTLRSAYEDNDDIATGPEYLVIWDRRPDGNGGAIDSYFEGEILAHSEFAELDTGSGARVEGVES